MGEICRENGLTPRQIFSIVKAQNVPLRERKRSQRRALSKVHQLIGQRLYDYYFTRGLDRRMAANLLGWSSLRLRNVELGLADLTLFELQDVSTFTGIQIGNLIKHD